MKFTVTSGAAFFVRGRVSGQQKMLGRAHLLLL